MGEKGTARTRKRAGYRRWGVGHLTRINVCTTPGITASARVHVGKSHVCVTSVWNRHTHLEVLVVGQHTHSRPNKHAARGGVTPPGGTARGQDLTGSGRRGPGGWPFKGNGVMGASVTFMISNEWRAHARV